MAFSSDGSHVPANNNDRSALYKALLVFLLLCFCLMPAVAALVPRFFGFISGAIIVPAFILFRLSIKRWPFVSVRMGVLTALFAGLCLVSAFWSFDAGNTLESGSKIALVLLSGVGLFSLLRDPAVDAHFLLQRLEKYFPVLMVAAGLVIILDLYCGGLVYFLLREPLDVPLNYSRMNRAVIAFTFLLLPALWLLWRGQAYSLRRRWAMTAALALVSGAVLAQTQSQSAQMAIAMGALFFAVFPYRLKAAWVALAGALVVALSLSPWLAQWMFTMLAASVEHAPWISRGYAAPRMEIWNFISHKILEQPFFGFGLDATRDIGRFGVKTIYTPVDYVLHPHNFALQFWIEFGALGVALVAAMFAVVLKSIHEQAAIHWRWLLALFMAFVAVGATAYGVWQAWWLGLILVSASFCALLTRKHSE